MEITTVFLDMDGVMANFLGGLHRSLGVPYDYHNYPYELGKWNMLTDIKGFDDIPATFEQCNDACNRSFWANLEWMHDGYDILRAITYKFAPANINLLTTCMPNPETKFGKLMWIEKELPTYFDRAIVLGPGESKGKYARPDALLIDDRDKNVEDFRAAGGQAILVNRPWNKGFVRAEYTCEDLENELKKHT